VNLVYLVGAPGVGKSTLMAELTGGCHRLPVNLPVGHDRLVDVGRAEVVAVELGRHRPGFPGTDTLPLNVSPVACRWVAAAGPGPLVLAEGDRLAHTGFLDAAAYGGYRVTVVHLTAPPDVLDARCAQRGSTQNEAWRQGRLTKSARLAAYAAERYPPLITLHTNLIASALAARLRTVLPALSPLPERTHADQL
jgi:hypothetical protein